MTKHLLMFTFVLAVCGSAFAQQKPTVVSFPLERSFVPIGYDDNDKVQLTLAGSFPDTCYRVASVKTRVDEATKTVFVHQTAYHYPGICIRVFVPFSSVADLGIIGAGEYRIVDESSKKDLGKLPVLRSAHSGADDYLYAAIFDATISNDSPGKRMLNLYGEMPDRCSELQDVQVHYYPEVIVVQPIAKRIGENCIAEKKRFIKMVPLDSSVKGVHLLHVRSLSGQAINKLVDVDELVTE